MFGCYGLGNVWRRIRKHIITRSSPLLRNPHPTSTLTSPPPLSLSLLSFPRVISAAPCIQQQLHPPPHRLLRGHESLRPRPQPLRRWPQPPHRRQGQGQGGDTVAVTPTVTVTVATTGRYSRIASEQQQPQQQPQQPQQQSQPPPPSCISPPCRHHRRRSSRRPQ